MKAAASQALEELRQQFGDRVSAEELPDGGVQVVVEGVRLGEPFAQPDTWVGFTLSPLYPYADVYPHFVRPDLARSDGSPLQMPLYPNNSFYGRTAVMVSRRTPTCGPASPNHAARKLLKVQAWLLSL